MNTAAHKCVYYQCRKSKINNLSSHFYSFPNKQPRLQQWLKNCGNTKLLLLSPSKLKYKIICDDHFLCTDFVNSTRHRLNKTAVPVHFRKTSTDFSNKQSKSALISDEERISTVNAAISKPREQLCNTGPAFSRTKEDENPMQPSCNTSKVVLANKCPGIDLPITSTGVQRQNVDKSLLKKNLTAETTAEFDKKLISVVKQYPQLYSPTETELDWPKVNRVWDDIGSQLNMKGPECRTIWENILLSYKATTRPNEKMNDSQNKHKYYDLLDFLNPLLFKIHKTYSQSGIKKPNFNEMSINATQIKGSIESTRPILAECSSFTTRDGSATTVLEKRKSALSRPAQTALLSEGKRVIIKTYDEYMRNIKSTDHLTTYFEAIEKTVRTFSPQLQIKLKSKISQLVHEAELEYITSTSAAQSTVPTFNTESASGYSNSVQNTSSVVPNQSGFDHNIQSGLHSFQDTCQSIPSSMKKQSESSLSTSLESSVSSHQNSFQSVFQSSLSALENKKSTISAQKNSTFSDYPSHMSRGISSNQNSFKSTLTPALFMNDKQSTTTYSSNVQSVRLPFQPNGLSQNAYCFLNQNQLSQLNNNYSHIFPPDVNVILVPQPLVPGTSSVLSPLSVTQSSISAPSSNTLLEVIKTDSEAAQIVTADVLRDLHTELNIKTEQH